MVVRRFRARLAATWIALSLATGAIAAIPGLVRELTGRSADGRGVLDPWRHAADPVEQRVRRSFGSAAAIATTLLREPTRGCLIRLAPSGTSSTPTRDDVKLAEALESLLFPTPCERLAADADPPPDTDRIVVDLFTARPLALPPSFEKVAETQRFAIWRRRGIPR